MAIKSIRGQSVQISRVNIYYWQYNIYMIQCVWCGGSGTARGFIVRQVLSNLLTASTEGLTFHHTYHILLGTFGDQQYFFVFSRNLNRWLPTVFSCFHRPTSGLQRGLHRYKPEISLKITLEAGSSYPTRYFAFSYLKKGLYLHPSILGSMALVSC